MRVKLKLALVVLAAVIIPIVTINIFSSAHIKDISVELTMQNTDNIISCQAENINYYFEDIFASAKEAASLETVRNYAAANGGDFSVPAENSPEGMEYRVVSDKLKSMTESDSSLKKAMIINNDGMIIASADDNDAGKRMTKHTGLFEAAVNGNGISPFSMSGDKDNNVPSFSYSKAIYSHNNELLGIVYEMYDTTYLQRLINNAQIDKYTTVAVMDSAGGILEYPYKTVRSYTEHENYGKAGEYVRSLLAPADTRKQEETSYSFGKKSQSRTVFSRKISSCGWTVLAVSNTHSLESAYNSKKSAISTLAVTLTVLAAAGTFVFIHYFSKPMDEIIRVLQKKQRGDVALQFDIRSNDEFRQIGRAFNTAFDEIFESEQRYNTIVEITNNIVFEVNFKKNTVTVSKSFNKKFSFRPKDDTVNESFLYHLYVHKDDKDRYLADVDRILGPANFIQGEYRVKSIYGDFIWIMIKATKFFNREEIPTKIVGVIMDIDKEKKSEMHLIQKASYDALTRLFNRETFLKSLAEQIEMSALKKTLDAMMFIDLDDFKFFNDEYGHACGDEVLKFTADTLKELSFERGFAGRFGGDEFVLCLTNLTLYGDSGKVAQELIDTLGRGFISESTGIKLTIHCSVGIAFLRESGKTTEEVIAAADEAMYNIKKHGKSAYAYAKSAQANVNDALLDEIDEIDMLR
ncbi:MAG: diguanylate cyclase [Ruminococcus sp.]|nr:diguanylate cyclase [Ruminococcus sp.]MCM1380679.1 diguanylate cyclase [Muribaculaceae bacterium]MCM1480682.1 diguanylate cyclase [Muribaculaceae bacterium]